MARKKTKQDVCHECKKSIIGTPYYRTVYSMRPMCSEQCKTAYYNGLNKQFDKAG